VIEARHVLSGMELSHRNTILGRLLGRAREDSAADIVFRLLHVVSGGNLQAALSAWCRAVTIDDGTVTVNPQRLLMERLPALTKLEAPILALLVQLVRFGPQDARRLAAALGLSRAEVLRHILLLENCGLLERADRQSFALVLEHRGRLVPRLPLSAERRA